MSVFGVKIDLPTYFDDRHFDREEFSPTASPLEVNR